MAVIPVLNIWLITESTFESTSNVFMTNETNTNTTDNYIGDGKPDQKYLIPVIGNVIF